MSGKTKIVYESFLKLLNRKGEKNKNKNKSMKKENKKRGKRMRKLQIKKKCRK